MDKNMAEAMKSITKSSIRLLVMVIFLGYIMIWIMMPTNTFYQHWLPNIKSKTSSTYFGELGGNFLVYTSPILFIAVLGCLYLHLGKNSADHDTKSVESSTWDYWKNPILVKGPLGIVSWTEFCLLIMFLGPLVWSFYSYMHDMFANATQEAAQQGIQVWEAKLATSGLLLGLVGKISLAFLFFPVTRGSPLLQLIGITSEASIKYHIWLGHVTMILFTAHGLSYVVFWIKTHQITQMLKWGNNVGISNVAGEISLLGGLVMWATTFPRIRRKMFELFFYTHHFYIIFVVFYVFHVGFSTATTLPGFYLFMMDRFLRSLQSQQRTQLVSARVLPCQAVELNFSKNLGLSYTPTSTIFVNIPSISRLQWHPFSIISSANMDHDKLSIIIKSEGSWSSKIYQMLSSPSPTERLEVSIEGPYGPPSTNFQSHDMVVMISGSSGLTPFISIIRELIFKANTTNRRTPRVLLVCAFKKAVDLTMLDLLLPVTNTELDLSRLQLQIEAYVTREEEPVNDDKKLIRSIWFKPNIRDVPVYPILGPRSWLWRALIIASSVVVFLVLIGILTQYYIHPRDQNSKEVISSPSRSALYMAFICISLVMISTPAFFWNKKQAARETPPTPSPCGGGDIESENLSYQTLRYATKFQYGKRPDFKKILFGCNGSNVRVLVSGPRKMRQEVAAICASGLADNLHFQSISFSW